MVTGALLGRLATRAWADTRRGREAIGELRPDVVRRVRYPSGPTEKRS